MFTQLDDFRSLRFIVSQSPNFHHFSSNLCDECLGQKSWRRHLHLKNWNFLITQGHLSFVLLFLKSLSMHCLVHFIGYHVVIILVTRGVVFSTEMNFLNNSLCCSFPYSRGFAGVDSSHLEFPRAHLYFVNGFTLYQAP